MKPSLNPAVIIVLISMVVFGYNTITGDLEDRALSLHNFVQDPFTLITYLFCSTSLLHLFINSAAILLLIDSFRSDRIWIGYSWFVCLFMLTGAIAGLVSIRVDPEIITAGSSGAIYGLAGSITIKELFDPFSIKKEKRDLEFWLIFWAIQVYINYALIKFASFKIDWINHLAGLISGMIITFIALYFQKIIFIYRITKQYKRDTDQL